MFVNVLPTATNTSSMTINPHHSLTLRYTDNIFLGVSASVQYTGVGGAIRQGLTHMAIPRGWSWGGPASEHCPVWCELYTQKATKEVTEVKKPMGNGVCVKEEGPIGVKTRVEGVEVMKVKVKGEISTGKAVDEVKVIPNGKCVDI